MWGWIRGIDLYGWQEQKQQVMDVRDGIGDTAILDLAWGDFDGR